jgi:hypothetical protein
VDHLIQQSCRNEEGLANQTGDVGQVVLAVPTEYLILQLYYYLPRKTAVFLVRVTGASIRAVVQNYYYQNRSLLVTRSQE